MEILGIIKLEIRKPEIHGRSRTSEPLAAERPGQCVEQIPLGVQTEH